MTDNHGEQPPLSNDHLVVVLLMAGLAVLAFHRRRAVGHRLGAWLRDTHIVLPGTAGLQIPHLGGLDVPRMLIAAGLLLLIGVTIKAAVRLRRPRV